MGDQFPKRFVEVMLQFDTVDDSAFTQQAGVSLRNDTALLKTSWIEVTKYENMVRKEVGDLLLRYQEY